MSNIMGESDGKVYKAIEKFLLMDISIVKGQSVDDVVKYNPRIVEFFEDIFKTEIMGD